MRGQSPCLLVYAIGEELLSLLHDCKMSECIVAILVSGQATCHRCSAFAQVCKDALLLLLRPLLRQGFTPPTPHLVLMHRTCTRSTTLFFRALHRFQPRPVHAWQRASSSWWRHERKCTGTSSRNVRRRFASAASCVTSANCRKRDRLDGRRRFRGVDRTSRVVAKSR